MESIFPEPKASETLFALAKHAVEIETRLRIASAELKMVEARLKGALALLDEAEKKLEKQGD